MILHLILKGLTKLLESYFAENVHFYVQTNMMSKMSFSRSNSSSLSFRHRENDYVEKYAELYKIGSFGEYP